MMLRTILWISNISGRCVYRANVCTSILTQNGIYLMIADVYHQPRTDSSEILPNKTSVLKSCHNQLYEEKRGSIYGQNYVYIRKRLCLYMDKSMSIYMDKSMSMYMEKVCPHIWKKYVYIYGKIYTAPNVSLRHAALTQRRTAFFLALL